MNRGRRVVNFAAHDKAASPPETKFTSNRGRAWLTRAEPGEEVARLPHDPWPVHEHEIHREVVREKDVHEDERAEVEEHAGREDDGARPREPDGQREEQLPQHD